MSLKLHHWKQNHLTKRSKKSRYPDLWSMLLTSLTSWPHNKQCDATIHHCIGTCVVNCSSGKSETLDALLRDELASYSASWLLWCKCVPWEPQSFMPAWVCASCQVLWRRDRLLIWGNYTNQRNAVNGLVYPPSKYWAWFDSSFVFYNTK